MSEAVSYLSGLIDFLASPGIEKTSFTVTTNGGATDLSCDNSLIPKSMKVQNSEYQKYFLKLAILLSLRGFLGHTKNSCIKACV